MHCARARYAEVSLVAWTAIYMGIRCWKITISRRNVSNEHQNLDVNGAIGRSGREPAAEVVLVAWTAIYMGIRERTNSKKAF